MKATEAQKSAAADAPVLSTAAAKAAAQAVTQAAMLAAEQYAQAASQAALAVKAAEQAAMQAASVAEQKKAAVQIAWARVESEEAAAAAAAAAAGAAAQAAALRAENANEWVGVTQVFQAGVEVATKEVARLANTARSAALPADELVSMAAAAGRGYTYEHRMAVLVAMAAGLAAGYAAAAAMVAGGGGGASDGSAAGSGERTDGAYSVVPVMESPGASSESPSPTPAGITFRQES
ncbi:hypothetical protein HYH02_004851 [Chlamydomonas schloesseri]|uniref:Uncharacterized protein n=1 Tax=Chlamydomonas schloesseri TaxID=2026947 RepID=A0A835WNW1_9CHLO|nr:hypothetical protein HYH02_004851 [Chlamydomonas schloesseri]|eukprot:KAG2450346.1 hypothetical protein HYH02_004851 [Chlamydomonas schloesseri]